MTQAKQKAGTRVDHDALIIHRKREHEGARGRVRRLLLNPLLDKIKGSGFIFPIGTDHDDAKKYLEELADRYSYMSDDGLTSLRLFLEPHGGGSARNHFPRAATFRAFAQIIEPPAVWDCKPIWQWFCSAVGPKVLAAGLAPETVAYCWKMWKPPASDTGKRQIRLWRDKRVRELELAQSRVDRGVDIDGDREALELFAAVEDWVRALIETGVPPKHAGFDIRALETFWD